MPNKRKPFFIRGKRRMRGAGTKVGPDHPYIKPDKTFDPQELLEQLSDAPGAFDLLIIDWLIDRGELDPKYHGLAEEIVSALIQIIADANAGDEKATNQLAAIEKLTRPEKFELPASKIKEIVDRYHTRPPLARGWELRRLMSRLASNAVEPVRADKPASIDSQVRLLEKPKSKYERYYWELARKFWKDRSTLQSLAIRIYLAQLQDDGITDDTISERSLKRDLAEVRKWEKFSKPKEGGRRGENLGASFYGSPHIEWADFSEGWKLRMKKRKV